MWITGQGLANWPQDWDVHRWDYLLEAAAAANDGLIRASGLTELGLTGAQQRAVRANLSRVRRDFYQHEAPADARGAHVQRLRAVLTGSGDRWIASDQSAAVLHNYPVDPRHLQLVHVAKRRDAPGTSRRGNRHGVHVHPELVADAFIETTEGLLTTNPDLTVVCCALRLPLVEALVVADSATHSGRSSIAALQHIASQIGRKVGKASLRAVLELCDPKCESPGETRTRLLLVMGGFEVESQFEILDDHGRFVARTDFKVRGTRVVVEFDGRAKFESSGDLDEAYWQWKKRLDDIRNQGYWPVVVTWRDLFVPGRVAELVGRAVQGFTPEG